MRDAGWFAQVRLDPEIHTLVWPNGADFDPATLHDWPEDRAEVTAAIESWSGRSQQVLEVPRRSRMLVGCELAFCPAGWMSWNGSSGWGFGRCNGCVSPNPRRGPKHEVWKQCAEEFAAAAQAHDCDFGDWRGIPQPAGPGANGMGADDLPAGNRSGGAYRRQDCFRFCGRGDRGGAERSRGQPGLQAAGKLPRAGGGVLGAAGGLRGGAGSADRVRELPARPPGICR